jgi:deoxyribodipyrimidine photo-lyase
VRRGVLLFTRDLRIADHPALDAARAVCDEIVPLFVVDERLTRPAGPARLQFLRESLTDLAASLARLGAPLVLRAGETVTETLRVAAETGAGAVFLSSDATPFAAQREAGLRAGRLEVIACPGVAIVAPHDIVASGGGAFRVFTPYWRRWRELPLPPMQSTPRRLAGATGLASVDPDRTPLAAARAEVRLLPGGERPGLARLKAWMRDGGPTGYAANRDRLDMEAGSLLGAYLHLGCVSPAAVARAAAAEPEAEAFLRQLCWRDFFHQLLAERPELAGRDLRPGRRWADDPRGLEAWQDGRTGYPVVDAGMRQLRAEGRLPNRARLITASFLTKHLRIDWRLGAAHYRRELLDGDVAANSGNWQWVAGTGIDPRPGRMLNPTLQAHRYDPDGTYVRRWVPELAGLAGADVHEPWRAPSGARRGYPPPLVDHEEARARFLGERRGR